MNTGVCEINTLLGEPLSCKAAALSSYPAPDFACFRSPMLQAPESKSALISQTPVCPHRMSESARGTVLLSFRLTVRQACPLTSFERKGGAPRNLAPRNHFWRGLPNHEHTICKKPAFQSLAGCACKKYRRVSTPLRSTSPFSDDWHPCYDSVGTMYRLERDPKGLDAPQRQTGS